MATLDPIHWVILLVFLLVLPHLNTIADFMRNFRGGGGNPPDHPLPVGSSFERAGKRTKDHEGDPSIT
ncbi:MAG: hypothetical protein JO119_14725 [Acidobacteria bacterium]|nr:hypothetical protein [Acidobacteriota bacterium]